MREPEHTTADHKLTQIDNRSALPMEQPQKDMFGKKFIMIHSEYPNRNVVSLYVAQRLY